MTNIAIILLKDIIACIAMTYGVGSSEKVNRYDYYEWSTLDFRNWDVANAYFYLAENGYISEYESPKIQFLWGNIGGDKSIGVSKKGWKWASENNCSLEEWENEPMEI